MKSFIALLALLALADGRVLSFIPPFDVPCPAGETPIPVGFAQNPLGGPSQDTPYHVDIYLFTPHARCVVAKCRSASTGVEVSGSPRQLYYTVGLLQLGGLEPGTKYACEAADVVGDISGPVFAFDFTTMPAPEPSPSPVPTPSPVPASPKPSPSPVPVPKPSKPVLRSVKTTKNGAVVTTTKPARATSFRANCRIKGTAKKAASSVGVSKTSVVVTLKNLKAKTAYACDILGANKSGGGPALAVAFATKK